LSVFLIFVFIAGVSASDGNDDANLSQSIDEVVVMENTDEILTVEGSSAGTCDSSGLKELGGDLEQNISQRLSLTLTDELNNNLFW